jgi:hypothetical protein
LVSGGALNAITVFSQYVVIDFKSSYVTRTHVGT